MNEGYNVTTFLWLWPKTQEAGFSHNALYAKDSCKWMMYFDVDEFLFSPSWDKESQPSDHLLKSLLPKKPSIGQVSFRCNDFGPSGQTSHPVEGVTQGYNCYRRVERQRHKSIVLLDAIDDSLNNVIHHFGLKKMFKWKQMDAGLAVGEPLQVPSMVRVQEQVPKKGFGLCCGLERHCESAVKGPNAGIRGGAG
ncbi:hypothetical protein Patl1_09384 [Pistacia atlantica]|uniref:Uncharacterized protein n=1 Tax=Pistacia atlantica TaxID=434234 RepID=A0ACC1AID3_9ROSI|nr:hypothetical protein Patl1_09384 [Pistacia atlantica]